MPLNEWEFPKPFGNKSKYTEFIDSEVPTPERGGLKVTLTDSRTKVSKDYKYSELIYQIRCACHEYENLNLQESVKYHILLDWSLPRYGLAGKTCYGNIILNAESFWWRCRQVVVKFIQICDSYIQYENFKTNPIIGVSIGGARTDPPLKSIKPDSML